MKIITVTYADNVEGVVVVNEDSALACFNRLKQADESGELHIQLLEADTFDELVGYVKGAQDDFGDTV